VYESTELGHACRPHPLAFSVSARAQLGNQRLLGDKPAEVKEEKFHEMLSVFGLIVLASWSTQAYAQDHVPLRLVQTIPMPNVKGRIDHMDVDVKGKRLFVTGLENGSLEVVDLQAGNGRKAFLVLRKHRASPMFLPQ